MRQISMIDRPIVFCGSFNIEIRRNQNRISYSDVPLGVYYFYSGTSDALVIVLYIPLFSLFSKKLVSGHYLLRECDNVESQY